MNHPVDSVEWVDRDSLDANDYNPNHVAPIELDLLATSILEDGWTHPLVVTPDNVIIDGYHRWLVSDREDVRALTDGKVPVVTLDKDRAHLMMSTVRHNRARGIHGVLPMADMVRNLMDHHGLEDSDLIDLLGMDIDEIERLYDQAGMPEKNADHEFNRGWVPDDTRTSA